MLSDLFPAPVPLAMGGGTYLVSQLRIADLAHLEAWVIGRLGTAWDRLREAEREADPERRRELLKVAYEAAEASAEPLSSDAASSLIFGLEGRAVTLWLSLRQAQDIAQDEALELACRLDAEAWNAFDRVAWDGDPLDEVAAAIDREIGVTLPASKAEGSWSRAVLALIRRTKLAPEVVGGLPLSAFRVLANGGKRSHPIAEPTPGPGVDWKTLDSAVNKPRRAFWNGNGHHSGV